MLRPIPAINRRPAFVLGALVFSFFTLCSSPAQAQKTDALGDYIRQSDDSFAWKKLEQREVEGFTVSKLECTSQTWRGHAWQHQMLVVRPSEVRNPDIAFLFISGDGKVDGQLELLRTLAQRTGAVAAVINRVPNQPLYDGRKEDALIAYTFDQYVKSGDPTWPLLFPMAKSAVRGMDAVQAFAKEEFKQKIDRFVTSGASKRGWTTWLSAAADSRVQAIAPMVIDMLNMRTQSLWAEKMYGRQSEKIKDYVDLNLIARMDEPRMVELRDWVDPFTYRKHYTMPKLLLLGTNDPYWVVDSLRHYWDELPEPKIVFQTPNAGHDLGGGREATQTLAAFFQIIADRQTPPRMTWQFTNAPTHEAIVTVSIDRPAQAFRLWTANSPDRDFRNDQWSSSELKPDSATNVVARIATPETGFRAYLVEAEFAATSERTFKLSTEARVTPDGAPISSAQK